MIFPWDRPVPCCEEKDCRPPALNYPRSPGGVVVVLGQRGEYSTFDPATLFTSHRENTLPKLRPWRLKRNNFVSTIHTSYHFGSAFVISWIRATVRAFLLCGTTPTPTLMPSLCILTGFKQFQFLITLPAVPHFVA